MLFKDISYLELWQPFCSAEWNHLYNRPGAKYIEKYSNTLQLPSLNNDYNYITITQCAILVQGIMSEQLCKIIFNLDQWFRRRYFLKIFLF